MPVYPAAAQASTRAKKSCRDALCPPGMTPLMVCELQIRLGDIFPLRTADNIDATETLLRGLAQIEQTPNLVATEPGVLGKRSRFNNLDIDLHTQILEKSLAHVGLQRC